MGKRSEGVYRNRQANLQHLIDKFGLNEAADILDRRYDYIKTLSGGKQKARTIGDSLANHIEESFGLPPGSLDQSKLPKITVVPGKNQIGKSPSKRTSKTTKPKLFDSKTPKEVLENRLWHIRKIIKSVGGTNEFSRLSGMSAGQVTAYFGPNPTRNIGPTIVARVENKFKIKPGMLDLDPPPEASSKDPMIAEICSTLAHANEIDKAMVLNLTQWLVQRSLTVDKTSASSTSGELVSATDLIS